MITIFVASLRDQLVNPLRSLGLILHPLYDWSSPIGKSVLENWVLDITDMPTSDNHWNQTLLRDYWALGRSDLMLFDLDKDPSEQFLAIALLHGVPTIGVSDTLSGLPFPYFSGMMKAIVKSSELHDLERLLHIAGVKLPQKAKVTGTPESCT